MGVSLLGLFGRSATQPLITNLTQAAPASVRQIIVHAVSSLQSGHGAAGFAAIIGIVLALWSASGYIAAFMRAANVVYDVPEGRPFWKTTPIRAGAPPPEGGSRWGRSRMSSPGICASCAANSASRLIRPR